VAQQPNSGLGNLTAKVPISQTIRHTHTHTNTHTHTHTPCRTPEQGVAVANICTTQNMRGKHSCSERDSETLSQHLSGNGSMLQTARPPGSAALPIYCGKNIESYIKLFFAHLMGLLFAK